MKKIFLFTLFFVTAPFVSFAQLTPQDLSVKITPELPEPGDQVSLDVETFVADLNRSQIVWTLDGKEQAKGVGENTFSFTAGAIGTSHSLTIVVSTPDAGILSKTITIAPASVDLLWEATDSYTPKFYKGKALNAHDSGVIVQALPYFISPNGSQVNPKSLIYSWSVNDKPQQSASGFGKDSFVFPGPSLYRAAEVTVDVESPNSDYRARRTINLSAQAPKILFYEESPLFGQRLVNPVAGGSLELREDEVVVRAEPYFFSNVDNSSAVEYEWKIDERDIVTVGNRNLITLRKPEEGAGRSAVSLEIKHIGKLLQFARESFTALFEERSSTPEENAGDTNFFRN